MARCLIATFFGALLNALGTEIAKPSKQSIGVTNLLKVAYGFEIGTIQAADQLFLEIYKVGFQHRICERLQRRL